MFTHFRIAGCFLLVCMAAGCSRDSEREAASPADASPGAGAGSSSALCSLFDTQEIQTLLGTPVAAATAAGGACQWDGTTDDAAYGQIHVVAVRYWTPPSSAEGYEKLSGIGKEAFVAPEMGGWQAGALTDTAAVMVSVKSGSANRDTAVRLLRDLLGRM